MTTTTTANANDWAHNHCLACQKPIDPAGDDWNGCENGECICTACRREYSYEWIESEQIWRQE